MKRPISDIAITSAVTQAQDKRGSRKAYASMEQQGRQGPWQDVVTPELAEFIGERDSLYLGTASAGGQPHVQHRGGPKGFIKVLDEHTLAFADYAGNAQYISLGNLSENDKAFIFLMDYPNRSRVKIWGTAEFVEDDPELLKRVVDPAYEARLERVLIFHVGAWSPNCTQHIQQRFTVDEMAPRINQLEERIAELEGINASLVKQLDQRNPKAAARELPDLVEASGT